MPSGSAAVLELFHGSPEMPVPAMHLPGHSALIFNCPEFNPKINLSSPSPVNTCSGPLTALGVPSERRAVLAVHTNDGQRMLLITAHCLPTLVGQRVTLSDYITAIMLLLFIKYGKKSARDPYSGASGT